MDYSNTLMEYLLVWFPFKRFLFPRVMLISPLLLHFYFITPTQSEVPSTIDWWVGFHSRIKDCSRSLAGGWAHVNKLEDLATSSLAARCKLRTILEQTYPNQRVCLSHFLLVPRAPDAI